jgi:hypothetical protein
MVLSQWPARRLGGVSGNELNEYMSVGDYKRSRGLVWGNEWNITRVCVRVSCSKSARTMVQ